MGKLEKFVVKYSQSLIALVIALVVLWFVLNFLHTRFGGNIVGSSAGKVGSLATGQAYSFGG